MSEFAWVCERRKLRVNVGKIKVMKWWSRSGNVKKWSSNSKRDLAIHFHPSWATTSESFSCPYAVSKFIQLRHRPRVSVKKARWLTLWLWDSTYTTMAMKGRMHVILNGKPLEEVDYFKYLGSQVEADGGCERDVVHRMNEGYRAWAVLKSVLSYRGLGIKAKKCLAYNLLFPFPHYGEKWTYIKLIWTTVKSK